MYVTKEFSPDHAMQCHKRYDGIRDALAKIIDEVAYDVRIEPPLEPLTGEELPRNASREDEARLDIAARGFWQPSAMAFFDVRVFNPFAKTHLKTTLDAAFDSQEQQKKTKYNQRVIQVEHGSFTPIVMSAYGGYGRETERFLSQLIHKISEKKDVPLSSISKYIRTKFLLFWGLLCASGEAESSGNNHRWTYRKQRWYNAEEE